MLAFRNDIGTLARPSLGGAPAVGIIIGKAVVLWSLKFYPSLTYRVSSPWRATIMENHHHRQPPRLDIRLSSVR